MSDIVAYVNEIWNLYDTDHDGFLSFLETRGLFSDIVRAKPELGYTFERHREWFEKIDFDGDGAIT
jgi:Ca2+-binding EF-hand superfamily protein